MPCLVVHAAEIGKTTAETCQMLAAVCTKHEQEQHQPVLSTHVHMLCPLMSTEEGEEAECAPLAPVTTRLPAASCQGHSQTAQTESQGFPLTLPWSVCLALHLPDGYSLYAAAAASAAVVAAACQGQCAWHPEWLSACLTAGSLELSVHQQFCCHFPLLHSNSVIAILCMNMQGETHLLSHA